MEKQSLITCLMVADAANDENIVKVRSIPDSVSLSSYFIPCMFLPEKGEIMESHEDTDQGHLLSYRIKVNIERDDRFHLDFFNKELLLYIETLNGERYYLGSKVNPCKMTYNKKSGASITDNNDTEIVFTHSIPL